MDAGCEYTGERQLLESHLRLQCPYAQVSCSCSEEACERTLAKKDTLEGGMAVHQESDLEVRPVVIYSLQDNDNLTLVSPFQSTNPPIAACEACENIFPSISILKDHLGSCPEKVVPCEQADNGCAWRGRRVLLETHTSQCPYESIKGFFAVHDARMTNLSKDNERLRRRTDELEGGIRILRQQLEWAKIALGPWYRPVYPERPCMSTNYAQYPNHEDGSTAPVPNRAGATLSRSVDPTGGASRPEPRVENGTAEAFDFVDPFAFSSLGRNQIPGVYATDNASTAATVNADSNTNPPADAVESHSGRNINRDSSYEPGPSDGPGSFYNTTGTVLSPGASDLQSTFTTPLITLLSDYFPSEDQELFEGGSSSRAQGWQHVPLPTNPVPPNPNPSIHSPVSTFVAAQTGGRGQSADHTHGYWNCLRTESAIGLRADSLSFGLLTSRLFQPAAVHTKYQQICGCST